MQNYFFTDEGSSSDRLKDETEKNISEDNYKSDALLQIIQDETVSREQLSLLDCGLPYAVCVIMLETRTNETARRANHLNEKLVKTTIEKINSEISEFHSVTCSDVPGQFILMIYNSEQTEGLFMDKLTSFISSLSSNINVYLNSSISIGISGIHSEIDLLPKAYKQALLQTEKSFYEAHGIYFYKEQGEKTNEVYSLIEGKMRRAILDNGFNNLDRIEEFFMNLCEHVKKEQYSPYKVKIQFINLISILQIESMRYQNNCNEAFPEYERLYEEIMQSQTIMQIESYLNGFFEQLRMEKKPAQPVNNYSEIVENAIKYLNKNFSDPVVSLKTTSKAISVNQSYLCRIFHKETGIAFNAYLSNLRMQKAKQLLVTTKDRIALIAEKSGYSNTNYFLYCFKKAEGVTPNTYRSKIHQSGS